MPGVTRPYMKLGKNSAAIELTMDIFGNHNRIYPVLLWDENAATLVDTGLPGHLDNIKEAMERLGVPFSNLKRVILTHQDFDHIGSLPEIIKEKPDVEVYAHADDVPYIQGERPLLKWSRSRMEKIVGELPDTVGRQAMAMILNPPSGEVTHVLQDGDELPYHGGLNIIHTPGHTPGHICIYVPEEQLLISGDELRVENDELVGPSPSATPDMPTALSSLKKLSSLPAERVICYHGGLWETDVSKRLQMLAADVS